MLPFTAIEKPAVPYDQDFTLEGTDTGFDENDPEQLCEECKPLGFCRKRHPERFETDRPETLNKTNA